MWFAIDLLDDSRGWWFCWPMLGSGLGVDATGIVMGGLGGLFGANWERRQIFALTELTAADEARIGALVKKAVS